MINGVPELEDLGDVNGKNVLVRVDFNVPVRNGEITDDLRIRAALPTLKWLVDRGANVTACSHLGRPKGAPDPQYSMEPVRKLLATLAPGVKLLENLRFNPGETSNDPAFVAELVAGQDLYVNDAFGASHREHASIVGPPQTLPCAAGRLLAKEVDVLLGVRNNPRRPFVGIMGGAKISDKLSVVEALLKVVDQLIVGGGMAYTFLAAQGHSVGDSLLEEDMIETCGALLKSGSALVLPHDTTVLVGGKLFDPSAGGEVRQMGVDIPAGAICCRGVALFRRLLALNAEIDNPACNPLAVPCVRLMYGRTPAFQTERNRHDTETENPASCCHNRHDRRYRLCPDRKYKPDCGRPRDGGE